ncbi:hypothetical protein, partial [Paraburkholderia caledonica]|uniref:hypothetical protein n=1 Tax=Paraburkholderia caledonica TaxID=134536 RepID=UPI003C9E6676
HAAAIQHWHKTGDGSARQFSEMRLEQRPIRNENSRLSPLEFHLIPASRTVTHSLPVGTLSHIGFPVNSA